MRYGGKTGSAVSSNCIYHLVTYWVVIFGLFLILFPLSALTFLRRFSGVASRSLFNDYPLILVLILVSPAKVDIESLLPFLLLFPVLRLLFLPLVLVLMLEHCDVVIIRHIFRNVLHEIARTYHVFH